MLRGESRYVTLTLVSKQNNPVVITQAVYDLISAGGQTVDSGACEIDGKQIKALLTLPDAGTYTLAVTYTMPPEIRKTAVTLFVRDVR